MVCYNPGVVMGCRDLRFTLPQVAQEALRVVAAREGQTQSAFVRSCILPFLRDEMRAIEARLKIAAVNPPPKRCRNCGSLPPR